MGCWRAARRRWRRAETEGKDPTELELHEAKKRIAQLERSLGRKTYEAEVAGELLRDWT